MIANAEKEGWHYFTVKQISVLLSRTTSKHDDDFNCLNCLHSFRTENKLKSQEKVCKNKNFCGIVMLLENNNILEFNSYMNSDKMPYIIYADIESSIKKKGGCPNNPKKSLTTKIAEHIPCGYSMPTILAFDHLEIKHTSSYKKDCMKKFHEYLREQAKIMNDFEKKKCYR